MQGIALVISSTSLATVSGCIVGCTYISRAAASNLSAAFSFELGVSYLSAMLHIEAFMYSRVTWAGVMKRYIR